MPEVLVYENIHASNISPATYLDSEPENFFRIGGIFSARLSCYPHNIYESNT
jgi:hypothetical protein